MCISGGKSGPGVGSSKCKSPEASTQGAQRSQCGWNEVTQVDEGRKSRR